MGGVSEDWTTAKQALTGCTQLIVLELPKQEELYNLFRLTGLSSNSHGEGVRSFLI